MGGRGVIMTRRKKIAMGIVLALLAAMVPAFLVVMFVSHRGHAPAGEAAFGILDVSPDERQRAIIAQAQEVLSRLMREHPRREIREDLPQLVKEGLILVDYRGMQLKPGGLYTRATTHGYQVFLNIPATLLLHPQMVPETLHLILWHEYIHFLQVYKEDVPQWRFGDARRKKSPEHIRLEFTTEVEACEAECKLAVEHGWVDYAPMCREYVRDGRRGLARWWADKIKEHPDYRGYALLLDSLVSETTP